MTEKQVLDRLELLEKVRYEADAMLSKMAISGCAVHPAYSRELIKALKNLTRSTG